MSFVHLFRRYLRDRGLPVTQQREAIAEVVFGSTGHLSVDEIESQLRDRGERIGKATIYRTLEMLVKSGLVAEHAIMYSRRKTGFSDFSDEENVALPPVPQALLRRHAGSGRMGLYLASHAGRILGMSEAEGQALLQTLTDHATQRQFVYTHRWRVHDLVMWDNRCTMHRGRAYEDLRWPRDMQRATVSDVASTCEQEGIMVPVAA